MELFKIACPSCATRLKVSQLSAIGQVLACPKCGGMVKVVAPEGWQPPADLVTHEQPAASLAPRKRPPEFDNLPETASQPFEDFDDIDELLTGKQSHGGKPKFKSENQPTQPNKVIGSPRSAANPAPSSRPPVDWSTETPALQKRKLVLQIALIVALFAAATIAVIVLSSTLFRSEAEIVTEGPTDKLAPKPEPATPNGPPDKQPAISANPVAVANPSPPLEMVPPALGVPEMSLRLGEPIAQSPPGFELPSVPKTSAPNTNLVDQFGDLNAVLNGGDSQLSMQELAEAAGPDRGQIGIGTLFIRKPKIEEIDVAARLADPIAEIVLKDVSLIDAMRTLSDLTAIPISYELDLIDVEGISLSEKLSLTLAGTTAGATLDALLAPRKLKAVTDKGLLIITVADREEWSMRDYDLAPLLADDSILAENFSKFLQNAIAKFSWQAVGGQGTISVNGVRLSVNQTAPVHALIGTLIEKLEAAKRLADQPNDEVAKTKLLSRRERSKIARQAAVMLNLLSERRLEAVLSTIARDSGTEIVVNWQALLREGWSPATLIPWTSQGEPLELKLRELTESMQLASRVIDDHMLQITTHQDAQRQLELEVYPCADLLEKYSDAQLLKVLDTVLGANVVPEMGMSVTLESTCRCFVAILPQPMQIRLEAALVQLRREMATAR